MSTDPQDSPRLLGEISQGPSAFEQFLDRNQKNLIILSIAIALGVAVFLVYQGIATSKERSAGADLVKAEDLAALQNLIKEYPATAAAGTANLALAERQWTEGQQATAVETLKAFIANNAKHPAVPSAKVSLAAKLKEQGKTDEAKAIFLDLSEAPESRFLAPYALISLGDLARAAGNLEDAEKSYQKAKTVLPGNSFSNTIDQRLANLKAKAPVEIDPPPAPPANAGTPGAPNLPTPGSPAIPGLPPAGKDTSDTDVPPVNFVPGGAPTPPAPAEKPVDPPAAGTPAETPAPPAAPAAPEKPAQDPAAPARSENPAPPAGEKPAP